MKFFIDTHDHRTETLPAGIGKEQFAEFFASYERDGLPFDTITEVSTATPGDLFFRAQYDRVVQRAARFPFFAETARRCGR